MSDSNLTPLMYMLGLPELAAHRPVWGSAIVYELYRRSTNVATEPAPEPEPGQPAEFAVRVIYNGVTQHIPACASPSPTSHPLDGEHTGFCTWAEFSALLELYTPSAAACPEVFSDPRWANAASAGGGSGT
jgi:hypothetical protein